MDTILLFYNWPYALVRYKLYPQWGSNNNQLQVMNKIIRLTSL